MIEIVDINSGLCVVMQWSTGYNCQWSCTSAYRTKSVLELLGKNYRIHASINHKVRRIAALKLFIDMCKQIAYAVVGWATLCEILSLYVQEIPVDFSMKEHVISLLASSSKEELRPRNMSVDDFLRWGPRVGVLTQKSDVLLFAYFSPSACWNYSIEMESTLCSCGHIVLYSSCTLSTLVGLWLYWGTKFTEIHFIAVLKKWMVSLD